MNIGISIDTTLTILLSYPHILLTVLVYFEEHPCTFSIQRTFPSSLLIQTWAVLGRCLEEENFCFNHIIKSNGIFGKQIFVSKLLLFTEQLGKGSTTTLKIVEENSVPVFLKFGTENCLGHLTVSAFMSVCQQIISEEVNCSIHLVSLRSALMKNSLNLTLTPTEPAHSESTVKHCQETNNFVFRLCSVTNEKSNQLKKWEY